MSDHASDRSRGDSPDVTRPKQPEAVGSIEAYEDDDTVVLYDAENPLAWVEATRTVALRDYA